jgi:release factor glutamine methyltransferase
VDSFRNGVIDRLQIKNYSINDVRRNCDVTFDIIISNPPYIKREDIPNLQPEIINYEDHRALDGGSDGLNIIEQVITAGSELLTQQGLIWLESSLDQGQNIKEMVIRKYPQIAYINQYPDITGRYRFHLLRKV